MLISTQFAAPLKAAYIENGQVNPIRWCVYHYEEDSETFTAQTGWFKCKDFFNDFVAHYNGLKGLIYNMNTNKIKLNSYGVWIRLKGVRAGFYKNALLVAEKFGVTIQPAPFEDDASHCLVLFPRELFNNTYIISLFTLYLRMANMPKEASSVEEIIKLSDEPLKGQTYFDKLPFQVPESLKDYWCYMGKDFNSKVWKHSSPMTLDSVHNNGSFGWYTSNVAAFGETV